MCGICGAVSIEGRARILEPGALERMNDALHHRGPDDAGTFLADGVAFAARRLSIVDVEGGHQPFLNEDGTVAAAQNGELYEHAAIRASLMSAGHRFRSRCDTEIIPHLYEEHGLDFPTRLRGMFAIVVWDERRRRLVLARDRLGIKPLYYAIAGDALVFGSEIKSILASGIVDADLDHDAIDAYLSLGFFPSPSTPLAGVRKVPPGTIVVVEDGKVREHAYWRYPRPEPDPSLSEAEHAERLLAKLDESVELRLMSDVPLGAMLSGGLDSSLIVALMARRLGRPVETFAVGFRGAGATSELADAREMAARVGADHHELELEIDAPAVDLEELCWFLDEPVADLSSLGFHALCGLARRHVTVALSGQGADELLAGYRKHRAAALVGAYRRATGRPGMAAARVVGRRAPRLERHARALGARDAVELLIASSGQVDAGVRRRLYRGSLADVDGLSAERAIRARLDGLHADTLASALYLDAQLALPDDMLQYFDRASMAHSLEVRVPFLDHQLVELCATIPSSMKIRRLRDTKHVLKLAARGLVPDRIIDKPKVGFFNRTVEHWLRAQTDGAVATYLLDPGARYAEMVDPDGIAELVRTHRHGDGSQLLLALLVLEVWLRRTLPRALGGSPRPPDPRRSTGEAAS